MRDEETTKQNPRKIFRSCLKTAKLRDRCGNTKASSVSFDFGFSILGFGLVVWQNSNPKSKIQNPKSKSPYFVRASANRVDFSVFKLLLSVFSCFLLVANYFSFKYFSIACVTASPSGFSLCEKRATTFPLRSIRNLLKFHGMSPAKCGFVSLLVRNL
jgi:hypothetical protein